MSSNPDGQGAPVGSASELGRHAAVQAVLSIVIRMCRSIRRLPALVLPLLLVAVACDGDGLSDLRPDDSTAPTAAPDATLPPDAEIPETVPPATETPETVPPASEVPEPVPPVTDAPEDSGDGRNWGVLLTILIGFGVLIAVAGAARKRRAAPATAPTTAGVDHRLQLVNTTRWIHDQLSLEILAVAPEDSQRRWAVERSRLDQLAIDLRLQATTVDPDVWNNLSAAVSALASALDTAVRVRSAPDADQTLVREAIALANQRRTELQAWLTAAQRSI